ncbi:MAG: protein kinase [Myxococcota bacterium]
MKTLGGYALLGSLSSGGMGHVFLAERVTSLGFRKRFAIKTLRRTLLDREDSVAAFIDEARLVAQLEHKNIAQVFDFGFDGDTPYLVMEYVPGASVQHMVARHGPLPPRAAFEIMREAADGLHAAHVARSLETGEGLRVVHRDVSLSNIMVSTQGEVKLIDFGIALAQDRMTPATMTGTIKGKPAYMAPEQLQGEQVDPRADVFALWVVFVEMLLGRSFFGRKTIYETTRAVMEAPLPTAEDLGAGLPKELDALLASGLHRDCEQRMPSAQVIVTAMDRLISTLPGAGIDSILGDVLALVPELKPLDESLPDTATTQEDAATVTSVTTQLPRRRRRTLNAITGVAVLLAAGLGSYLWSIRDGVDRSPGVPPVRHSVTPRSSAEPMAPVTTPKPVEATPTTGAEQKPQPSEPAAEAPVPIKRGATRRKIPARKLSEAQLEAKPAAPKDFGRLSVFADPFARVRVDGREIGVTPIVNHRLAVGAYTVELLDPDSGGVRKIRRVSVAKGEPVRVTDR